MGQLVFQATLGGQVNLIGPNTASTFNINVPATSGNMVTTGDTATVTTTMLASTTGSGAVVLATSPTLVTPSLGTPSALVGTNITGTAAGLSIGGNAATATTATNVSGGTSSVTSETVSGNLTLSGGTANGVAYLNGSKVVTTGSALVFDGTNLGLGVTPSAWSGIGKTLQVNTGGSFSADSANSYFATNSYYNGTNWIYNTSNYATRYTSGAGQHQWYTAPSGTAGNAITFTQAMTLDASGNLLVGRTSASDTVVGATLYANGTVTAARASSSNGDANFYLYSTTAAAARFYVDMGGTIHATSIVITAISDQRLKENVRDIDTGLSAIMALKPRRFDWKEGKGQDKKNAAGFIAQEFGEVFPASLSTFKAGGDGIEYLSMNHEELIPSLVKAIQEQQALIEQLTARLAAAGI